MSLIKLTALQREGRTFAKDMLIDISDISRPMIENISNNSVVYLQEGMPPYDNYNESNGEVQYIFTETLAVLTALANKEMFTGTVVFVDGRSPIENTLTFVLADIVGAIVEDPSGSKFLYKEGVNVSPVEYVVSQTIAQILVLIS